MKKITLFLFTFLTTMSFAQQKTTGNVNFLQNLNANFTLDNTNSTVTLILSGPSDRWFAVTFGSFGQPGAMSNGNDIVYYNGTTLVDANHEGQGIEPNQDSVNDWTVISNTVATGTRTIVATRPFVAEATDYTFNFANNSISLAGAHGATSSTQIAYHQNNRVNLGSVNLTTLGVEDFSLNASKVFPNPSKGNFTIQTKTFLNTVNIYTQTGAFVKSVNVENGDENVDINIVGLQSGIYLVELVNDTQKSWKKVIVN